MPLVKFHMNINHIFYGIICLHEHFRNVKLIWHWSAYKPLSNIIAHIYIYTVHLFANLFLLKYN